jgi:hypothetical protein
VPPLHSTNTSSIAAAQRAQVEPGHDHRAASQQHLLPSASSHIGSLSRYLDRAHRAGHLFDGAAQTREPREDVPLSHGGRVRTAGALAFGVISAGGHAQPHGGTVNLGLQRKMPEQLGGALHTADQHAGG